LLQAKGIMIASILIIVSCAATVAVQSPSQLSPRPMTSDAIVAAIGTDGDARDVIQLVLAKLLAQGSSREFVLDTQISAHWLPSLSRVQIIRLADTAVDAHLAACGLYWFVSDVKRTDNVVSLKVSQRCSCTTRDYVISFEDGAWHLGPPRAATGDAGWTEAIGSGCAGPLPGCPCFGRR
jgi:hypothetical protein